MRFAITGTDARFLPLRKLLLADGHEITDPASADMVISPPWDPSARYAHLEEYQIANAQLTAEGAVKQRFLDMGITRGVSIIMERRAPFGDPLAVRLRGYSLSLRRDEAQKICLEEWN